MNNIYKEHSNQAITDYRYKVTIEIYIIGGPVCMYYGNGRFLFPYGIGILNPTKIPAQDVKITKDIFEWGTVFYNKQDAINESTKRTENSGYDINYYEYPIATIKALVEVNTENKPSIFDFCNFLCSKNNKTFKVYSSYIDSIELPISSDVNIGSNNNIKQIVEKNKNIDLKENFVDKKNNYYYSTLSSSSLVKHSIPNALKTAETFLTQMQLAQNKNNNILLPLEIIDHINSFIIGDKIKRKDRKLLMDKNNKLRAAKNDSFLQYFCNSLQKLNYSINPQMDPGFYADCTILEDKNYQKNYNKPH